MLQKIRWFLLLVGVSVIVILAFQNSRSVEFDLLFFSGEYPLTLLLLACSAVSFVFGSLTTGWMLRSRSKSAAQKSAAQKNPNRVNEPANETTPLIPSKTSSKS